MQTILELFRNYFYWIDFTIGTVTPISVYALYKTGKIDKFIWVLFWVGFGLGLTWEIPMSTLNEFGDALAVHRFVRPSPAPFWVIIIMHSFWDGGLFLLGVLCVKIVGKGPLFEKFSPRDLIALVIWGQASELWVEMTSTLGEAWVYIPRPWNPSLFQNNGHDITLMPQLIWLAAPIAFYFIALKLRPRFYPSSG